MLKTTDNQQLTTDNSSFAVIARSAATKQSIFEDLIGKECEIGGRGPEKYDCYGLVKEIYRRLGTELPEYTSTFEDSLIGQMLRQGLELFEKLEKPEPYCIVTFIIRPPYVSHIGVVLEDCNRFIHVQMKRRVCIERLDDIHWQRRIRGYYKYTYKEVDSKQ